MRGMRTRLTMGYGRTTNFLRRKPFFSSNCSSRRSHTSESFAAHDACTSNNPTFNYTSGRWLYNESKRLGERKQFFNVQELCCVVAKAANLPESDVKRFLKIAEGGSYRVFEITFQNGSKVIARLPYPCTIPRKYGIASEVATMEYLRSYGVPIPKVLAWSSSSSNPVGSEYIIMERAKGKELGHTWYTMSRNERSKIIKNIIEVEKLFFEIPFPACGSIFFKSDLHAGFASVPIEKSDKFCIGPSTEYLWWYQGRDELKVNSGPWLSTESVMRAVAERELAWLRKFGAPRYPHDYLHRELYDHKLVDPLVKSQHLSSYLAIVPYIVPAKETLHKATIRHPDLSPSNIFISDSGEITGIIDWQHAAILPIFLQAIIPKHFQNYGDVVSDNLKTPQLPANYESMTAEEKEHEDELYRRRQVHYFYLGYTGSINPSHLRAMGNPGLLMKHELFDFAGKPWEGDNISLQAKIINTVQHWDQLATSTVDGSSRMPIQLDSNTIETCLAKYDEMQALDLKSSQIREHIGIDVQGWVPNAMFKVAKEKVSELRLEMLGVADSDEERAEINKHWPFQDHEEID